jgi:hypothetical protein
MEDPGLPGGPENATDRVVSGNGQVSGSNPDTLRLATVGASTAAWP